MKTTRRQFIKIAGAGTAGMAVAGSVLGSVQKISEKTMSQEIPDSELTRTPTYCEVCFWKCGAWVYKDKAGNIIKIKGNEEDQHARGKLCPRGTAGLGMYYDEDRLKKPLKRITNSDGTQEFKEVEWDEAIDFIASKMNGIKKKYGAESMGLFVHGAPAKHFDYLMSAFGTHNHAEPAYAQCTAPREAAFVATYGAGVGSPEPADMQNSKCITFIGNHIGENMHNSFVQEVSMAVERKSDLVVVDPRFSTVAAKAKHWLPIKPGTDIALLLAWMHVLIYDNIYDKKYIEQYAYGFDQLKAHVANYTPEWAGAITGVEPALIRASIETMAAAAPASVIHPGRHVTWWGDDTQRLRSIAIINALMGAYGKKGGMYMGVKQKLPKFPVPEFHHPHWSWKDITKPKYKNAAVGVTNILIDASMPIDHPRRDTDKKYQIKGWFIAGTSLINSIPDREKIIAAIDNQELVVVVDTMPMEMTGYADIVLPEATYLERHDYCRAGKNRVPQVAFREPATETLYDSKPAWWIARKIGHKLGLKKWYPWKDLEEVLAWQFEQVGTSLEEMKRVGVKTFETPEPIYIGDGEDFPFNTNTGKIELYCTDFAEKGYDPLPKFTQHRTPDAGYFHLLYGRAPMHTFGRSQNNPWLYELMSENAVWVNPKSAKVAGLKNGEYTYLQNQDGVVSHTPIKIRVTERIRPDSVYMVHGFGHFGSDKDDKSQANLNSPKKMSRAYRKGASDIQLMTNIKIDPIVGSTGMRENFVTFVDGPAREEDKS